MGLRSLGGRLRASDPRRREARPEDPRVERGVGPGPAELLDTEGIFGGVSAGAVAHVARQLAAELEEGVVVCVLADGGWKYLSADFWEAHDVAQSMERTVWW